MRHNGAAMTWRPNVMLGWLGALVGSVVLGGCSSSSEGTCVVGTHDCVCFPNMTCERGLECAPATNTCAAPVRATGGGPSGQAGSDSAVADDDTQLSGAGTSASPAGGTGGDPTASGGSDEPTGGTTPTGGQAPTGGTSSSGGESSSGGAGGTAGDSTAGGEAAAGGSETGGEAGETATGGSDEETGGTAGTSSGGTPETSGGGGAGGFGGTAGNGGHGGDLPATGGTTGTGVPIGVELIQNGDFSAGDTGWSVSGGSGTFTSDGALCVSGRGGDNPLMGWPADAANGVRMAAGTSYELSFRFRGESTGFDVKVGGVYDPWPEAFRETELAESSVTWRDAELTIEIPAEWGGDSDGVIQSGVAFVVWFTAGQMEFCIDDVSLMRVE